MAYKSIYRIAYSIIHSIGEKLNPGIKLISAVFSRGEVRETASVLAAKSKRGIIMQRIQSP